MALQYKPLDMLDMNNEQSLLDYDVMLCHEGSSP